MESANGLGEISSQAMGNLFSTSLSNDHSNQSNGYVLRGEDLYTLDALVEAPESILDEQPHLDNFQVEILDLIAELNKYDGHSTLVLLPTANKDKASILKTAIPANIDAQFEVVKADSSLGEQPFNEAGAIGALDRISVTLEKFVTNHSSLGNALEYCKAHNIGKILVVAIENYIAGKHVEYTGTLKSELIRTVPSGKASAQNHDRPMTIENPVDIGVAVLYDVLTGSTHTAYSRGVKVPTIRTCSGDEIDFVAYARTQGYENGDIDQGAQTAGNVIQAFVEPTKGKDYNIGQNWHSDVTGGTVTRYSLLGEAVDKIRQQAEAAGVFDVS